MIIVRHRVNTVKELQEMPEDFGVEADVRCQGDDLILHHDPLKDGENLEDFLAAYSHRFCIFDIKSEGIEKRVIELAADAGVEDYYLLNVNFPVIVKLAKTGFSKMSIPFSEFQSIETCLNMKGKVDFVWVESFNSLALTKDVHDKLAKHFKLSLVSPELYGRQEIERYRQLLKGMKIHDVCTDFPEKWK